MIETVILILMAALGFATVELVILAIAVKHILKVLIKIEKRIDAVTATVEGVSVIATFDMK